MNGQSEMVLGWLAGEPDDGGGDVEDGLQNHAVFYAPNGGIYDEKGSNISPLPLCYYQTGSYEPRGAVP